MRTNSDFRAVFAMRFSLPLALLLPLLLLLGISTSAAETKSCPTLQRSKLGAWLLIIDGNFRVRIERQGENIDLGLKVEALGEDYNRMKTTVASHTALNLTGEIVLSSTDKKTISAIYANGLALIFTDNSIISINDRGEVTCSAGDPEAAWLYLTLLQAEGYTVRSHKVSTASHDALASALGL